MTTAIVRTVSASLPQCEVTYVARQPIDVDRARAQHAAYARALEQAGAHVITLPPEDDLPDAVFVEDPILILDECAIVLAPGAESRRREAESLSAALDPHRPLLRIPPDSGTIDGGDVVRIEHTLYVGRSPRTNDAGIAQLRTLVEPLGYDVVPVDVTGCLHLKTACTWLGDALLINPQWIDASPLAGLPQLRVADPEPWGANALRLPGGAVICSAAYPETGRTLRDRGYEVIPVDVSELHKAEAGVTCMSVVFAA